MHFIQPWVGFIRTLTFVGCRSNIMCISEDDYEVVRALGLYTLEGIESSERKEKTARERARKSERERK